MSSDLRVYINNRIIELQQALNNNINALTSNLKRNTQAIQKTRLRPAVKNAQINNLIATYNKNVNALKQNFNNSKSNIQNYRPNEVIINKNKKALLIGINYLGTQNELRGCINDVNCIKNRLSQKGFNGISILTDLTPVKPTKANILKEFQKLLSDAQPGDLLFFAFSGHGSYKLDRNGDENTGYDQLIVPSDFNTIVDDDLKTIIQNNLKSNVTLFAMFDSCFSGSVLDLKYQFMDSLNYEKYTENNKQAETKGDVFMISGCSDSQTSADAIINNSPNGAMTWSLLEALKQNSNCSWRELLINMRNLLKASKFDQIPQFSTGNFENIDLSVFI